MLDAPFPTLTRTTAVLAIVAVATVLITLIGVLLVVRGPNDTDDIATSQAPPTEQGHTTIDAGTTSRATATATVAPTTTVPPDPAAIPPAPPEPGPIDAPGSPQVLATQQPSGLWFFEVEESFRLAQSFSDALALERWPEARLIDSGLTNTSDADFIAGYGNTDRVSLMLLDARQNGPSVDELLIVSVAVEFGGSRTSLYCLNWAANTETDTIDQQGGGLITTWQGVNAQPEAIRNDPAALDTFAMCTWPDPADAALRLRWIGAAPGDDLTIIVMHGHTHRHRTGLRHDHRRKHRRHHGFLSRGHPGSTQRIWVEHRRIGVRSRWSRRRRCTQRHDRPPRRHRMNTSQPHRNHIATTGESNGAGLALSALCDPRLDGTVRSAVMGIPAVDGGNGLLPQAIWFEHVAAARGVRPSKPRSPSPRSRSCDPAKVVFRVPS